MAHWLYAGEIELTKDEKKMRDLCFRTDYYALPVVAGIYCLGGIVMGKCSAIPNFAMTCFGACLASTVVYQDARVVITPLEEDVVMFKAQSRLGKWIFLTRHILAFQAVHFIGSLVTPYSYSWSMIVSGLAIFITIQYFTLVHWNPEFIQSCEIRSKRGIPFRQQMIWTHVPAGCLGIMDLYSRGASDLLENSLSFPAMSFVILIYALSYTGFIHKNFDRTGEWPYAILDPLGKSLSKWTIFIAGQTAILTGMVGISYLLVKFRS